jgi:hypothetical protein
MYSNHDFYDKFQQLEDIMDSMSTTLPHKRPNCDQVLAQYSDWSIDGQSVTTDPDYSSTHKLIKQNVNNFFYDYLCDKLFDKQLVENLQKLLEMIESQYKSGISSGEKPSNVCRIDSCGQSSAQESTPTPSDGNNRGKRFTCNCGLKFITSHQLMRHRIGCHYDLCLKYILFSNNQLISTKKML